MKMKFLAIFLVLLCCLMGAASAAEDISTDAVDDAIDDVVITDEAVDVDLPTDDSISAEPADADSEADQSDVSIETNDEEGNTRATTVTVNNWAQLAGNASSSGDKTINLASGTYTPTSQIVFGNNAKIVGTSTSYISGSYSGIPFYGSNTNYHITFENVKFKDLSCTMVMQMLTSGTTVIKGCTFENVNASSSGHNSVIYNNYGTMNITNCVFRNCNAAFGVITNHNTASTTAVIMNVRNCTFENNYGYTEPGCINNCGILNVYNCTFNNNSAYQWAGAIHTHSNANTVINQSTFKHNVAGWNGGALYTYSVLRVYNSFFEDNNCSTNNGGGAIGAYNYGSQFDIIINNSTFKRNNNLNSNGRGGAIGTLNGGYLNVYNSTFIANNATNGQAISAANKKVVNGTSDRPYLAIDGNTFINHTGSGDTVYINGIVNSFNDNHFYNSTQSTIYPGSGNTYASINPIAMTKGLLGAYSNDVLSEIQREVTDDDSFEEAFSKMTKTGYGSDAQVVNILVSPGTYTKTIKPNLVWEVDEDYGFGYYKLDGAAKLFALGIFNVEGTGEGVIFRCDEGYNLDLKGGLDTTEWDQEALRDTISHKNIISIVMLL